MATTYDTASSQELLAALEQAGRTPDLALIRACMEQQEALTPTLLAWMDEARRDEPWPDDDPRWYKPIHAGQLLLHWREEAALPRFEAWLRSADPFEDTPLEWFDTSLESFGPPAIPMLARVTADTALDSFARSLSAGTLEQIAAQHPEQREAVIAALRAALPEIAPGERRDVTEAEEEADLPAAWSWTAWYLCELHDHESRERIAALFANDMIDESIAGGMDDYMARLDGDEPLEDRYGQFDILETYESVRRQEEQAQQWRAQAEQRKAEQAMREAKRAQLLGGLPPQKTTQPGRTKIAGGETFVRATPKVGRNEPCPCGSGRKYKHCHGK